MAGTGACKSKTFNSNYMYLELSARDYTAENLDRILTWINKNYGGRDQFVHDVSRTIFIRTTKKMVFRKALADVLQLKDEPTRVLMSGKSVCSVLKTLEESGPVTRKKFSVETQKKKVEAVKSNMMQSTLEELVERTKAIDELMKWEEGTTFQRLSDSILMC